MKGRQATEDRGPKTPVIRLPSSVYLILLLLVSGCALNPGENRKVTAWGVWCTAAACGVGYWHSERGPDVESEESAQPPKL